MRGIDYTPNHQTSYSFFSYWRDGFAFIKCFRVLAVLFVWIALNKSSYLSLLDSKAGLRIEKSVSP